ncbi:50S ribosomal protein L20 [Candidatus Desantisbacteria bacterium CG1_02_38_46]|uniref:Large ribosomal subunit protein bL20 n=3 Tax=unclassified Candidatus Desantisiibacteriota TaxID=3106372 RepID=A0A2H9P9K7_9BACT|nr:MAG: 50S ribosomal protein L20 [Candidatus Desantisbacteria bacterium CG1_02_38_46]PIU50779.1 MAG: 50S ribosomal protein L20 [Candidatus Desantisbacteria bacterium CG07_land_8_20_14_0_80_39_15]PIZ14941.1 MAG: 50S ribosomal protein L20 [Candidatus Desantisbacteria bacterium CG_4_10_14_0_8_um_filter_39_17]
MRIKRAIIRRRRKKKIFHLAKGYYGAKSKLFRTAVESVRKGLVYAYRHRKEKKGDFRRLWNAQINAAVGAQNLKYNHFIHRLKKLNILLNRKLLAYLANNDEGAISYLVSLVKGS